VNGELYRLRNVTEQEVNSRLSGLAWLKLRPGGVIVETSQSLLELLGFSANELINSPFSFIFDDAEKSQELPEAQSIVAASQGEITTKANLRHKSGRLIRVTLFCRKLGDSPICKESVPYSVPLLVVVFEKA
jgi:PAS domain S-box-containing protein